MNFWEKLKAMEKKKKKARGFTLVEVLVVAAGAGVLALGVGAVIKDMLGTFKRIQAYQSLDTTHVDIMTLLINRDACRNTFQPRGSLTGSPAVVVLNDRDSIARYQTGVDYEREFQIVSMQVLNYTGPASFPGAGRFDLMINYRFLSQAVKPQNVTRRISFDARMEAGNLVNSCWSSKASEYDDLYINTSGPPETKNGDLTILGTLDVRRSGATTGGSVITEEYFQTSDRRVKTDIKTIRNALTKVNQLNGVEFEWISRQKKDWGFIAQDVEKIAPFLVNTDSETSLKSVNYSALIALSVEAIKELDSKNKRIKKEFEELKSQTDELISKVCRDHPKYKFCTSQGG